MGLLWEESDSASEENVHRKQSEKDTNINN